VFDEMLFILPDGQQVTANKSFDFFGVAERGCHYLSLVAELFVVVN
jgi:hypothetical protein